ncbi:LOW QUALITY PROTEIN: biotin-protein ligase [Geomicrobium sp. JCM 19039]|nr:LOW QUALITY PROTEIN: biotin-protein ligase [Geomicrobium sp. JCM 19039]
MKTKLLELLEDANRTYRSGQEISDHLNVSRTAVWKHIESLRQEGYGIEAVPRRGYRIVSRPNTLNESEVRKGLNTKHIGQYVRYEPVVSSTQDVMKEWYKQGAVHGAVVTTEEQTSGRGEMSRPWQAPQSKGIMFSLLVTPHLPLHTAPQLTLVTAVAVAKACEKVANVSVSIKWPNDLYIGSKKIAGILTEVQAEGSRVEMMVAGIGLNVNETTQEMVERGLEQKASSLYIETKQSWNRKQLLQEIFSEFEHEYERWINEGFQSIRNDWERRALLYGQTVTVTDQHRVVKGKMVGITDDGVLRLEDETGVERLIYSGDLQ